VAWRMYTRTIPVGTVEAAAHRTGDPALADRLLRTVAIVA
jgi:hypothetical protein